VRYLVLLCMALLVWSILPSSAVGLDGKMVRFTGGSGVSIPMGAPGHLKTDHDSLLVFTVVDDARLRMSIPYKAVTGLEYGQEVSRRVAMALALRSYLPLLSKTRKHFLTIDYTDTGGAPQTVVFELGKEVVSPLLAILVAKTGKKIVPQDDEARKTLNRK